MKTYTAQEIEAARAAYNVIHKEGKRRSFADFTKGIDPGTDEFKAKRAEYNAAAKLLDSYGKESATESETRLAVSLVNRGNHKLVRRSGVAEESILHKVSEAERLEKREAYYRAVNRSLTLAESGLTVAEFIAIARHDGAIPLRYKVENEKTGKFNYTVNSCKRYVADRDRGIEETRKVTLPAPVMPDNIVTPKGWDKVEGGTETVKAPNKRKANAS